MATLYLTEYTAIGIQHGAAVPIADTGSWTENANSPITISVTSSPSAPFGASTALIRVHCDSICSIRITNTGLVASTSNARLAANQTEYFAVHPGQILTVISNS